MSAQRLATTAAAVMLTLVALPSGSYAQTPELPPLSATVLQPSGVPGSQVRVVGEGWPSNGMVQVTTCGQLATRGSADCDLRQALATPVRDGGHIDLLVTVGTPPVPCPCVLHVTTVGQVGQTQAVEIPFEVVGVAVGEAPIRTVAEAQLEVLGTQLRGRSGLGAWFGGRSARTVDYTIRNVGGRTLDDAALTATLSGSGAEAVDDGRTGPLAPGETRTYQVDVPVPIAAFGTYTVELAAADMARADVSFSVIPWGLVLLNVLGLSMIVAGIRRRRRSSAAESDVAMQGVPLASGDVLLLPDVVSVPALGAYLVFSDTPAARPLRRRSGGNLDVTSLLRLAGVGPTPTPDQVEARPQIDPARDDTTGAEPLEPPRVNDAAVIDLDALELVLAHRRTRSRVDA